MMLLRDIYKALSRRRGQISLEIIAVFIPWLFMTFLFFNFIFILSSLMLVQASVNRAAMQAATIGCLPDGVRDQMESSVGFGGELEDVYVATNQQFVGEQPPAQLWTNATEKAKYIEPASSEESGVPRYDAPKPNDPSGELSAMRSAWCEEGIPAEYGHIIYVAIAYRQNLALTNIPFTSRDIDQPRVVRSAVVVSQRREGATQ